MKKTAAMPAQTLADRIAGNLTAFTASEKRAARALLARYPTTGIDTIQVFADRAAVSPQTILRFVAKLGFDGFAEFRRALREELEAQTQFPLTLAAVRRPESRNAPLAKLGMVLAQSVADTFALTPEADLERGAALIANDRSQVSLLGGNFTEVCARHLEFHLRKMRRGVRLLSSDLWRRADELADMGKRDVLIAFDVRRYQQDVIRTARDAHARGATVLLFTDQWLSDLADVADLVYRTRVDTISPWDTLVGMIALVEALALRVDAVLATRAQARLETIETLRIRLGVLVGSEVPSERT